MKLSLGFIWSLSLWATDPTFVVIPDAHITQNVSGTWVTQVQWINSHKTSLNIQGVFFLGDIDNGGVPLSQLWNRSGTGFGWMTIAAMGVPFGSTLGNHEYFGDAPSDARNSAEYDADIGYAKMSGQSGHCFYTDGSGYKANQCLMFTEPTTGRKFGALFLEFCPREAVMTWASGIVNANPSYEWMVFTHGYMEPDGDLWTSASLYACASAYGLTDWTTGGDAAGGSAYSTGIQGWAKGYPQVRAIFNGHHLSATELNAARQDTHTSGSIPLHGLFANYQFAGGGTVPGNWGQSIQLISFAGSTATVRYVNTSSDTYEGTVRTLTWPSSLTGMFPLPSPLRR